MGVEVLERLKRLRKLMSECGADGVYIPTADCHQSEYPPEHYKSRQYISGFTGSAGTAFVTLENAYLWVDGRYHIQGEKQTEGSSFKLMKMGLEGVPDLLEIIKSEMPTGGKLFLDGSVVPTEFCNKLKELMSEKDGSVEVQRDLVGEIWENRPPLNFSKAWILEEKYSGKSITEKLSQLRLEMDKLGGDINIITALDDVNWLYNIRGNDAPHFPVISAFSVVTKSSAIVFASPLSIDEKVKYYLESQGVILRDYDDFYNYPMEIEENQKVILNPKEVNVKFTDRLPKSIEVINAVTPVTLAKACKNPAELENLRIAHIYDGVAFTKFFLWLKRSIGKVELDEFTASEYLGKCRREMPDFLDESFGTISAYNANAAMMHYSASPQSSAKLKAEGMLLVDSGGHYLTGSTDITRTIILGDISEKAKRDYTAVLKAMLALSRLKFLKGCTGQNVDILCRSQLWQYGIDYRCGTGHGVGYLLNIHEGPNSIHWGYFPNRTNNTPFEEGMVTTNEPGVYIKGEYGIRTENELICREDEKNEYGQFMRFDTITFAPIDIDGIDTEQLTFEEKNQLNSYHRVVYQQLSPYLTESEGKELEKFTREM